MDPAEYEVMYRVEDTHWWYRGMAAISLSILKVWIPVLRDLRILDAGCGTGATIASLLSGSGEITGIDLSRKALQFCQARGIQPLVRASVGDLPLVRSSFDLITSLDVLYSADVPNVAAALKELNRVLTPDGHLLLRVPAYNWLRGSHDVIVHTARRFTLKEVIHLLESAGFIVLHATYANTLFFPFVLIKRMIEKILPSKKPGSDLKIRFGILNQILTGILSLEAPLAAKLTLPYGLSVIAIARRK